MLRLVLTILALLVMTPVRADTVQLTLPNALVATAEYWQGDSDKPVVLVLHGFLQTYHFPTVYRLSEGLYSEGYSVLAPSLTLGVTYRRQSLACEAIHTHTLEQDLAEIGAWIDWLKAHGHTAIILSGHSAGSLELLAYVAGNPDPAIRQFVGVSIIEGRFELSDSELAALQADLGQRIARHDRSLVRQQFSFCTRMLATPASLYSYLSWTPEHILAAAHDARIPVSFIVGSKDERLGADWIRRLRATGREVHVIEGANHFMDGEHEFDLLDTVLAVISEEQKPSP